MRRRKLERERRRIADDFRNRARAQRVILRLRRHAVRRFKNATATRHFTLTLLHKCLLTWVRVVRDVKTTVERARTMSVSKEGGILEEVIRAWKVWVAEVKEEAAAVDIVKKMVVRNRGARAWRIWNGGIRCERASA